MEAASTFVNHTGKDNSALNTIPLRLQYFAKLQPTREAVVFLAPNKTREAVTFQKLYDRSERVALALVALGVKPRESVAITLPTCPEWLYTAFGAMIAGACPVAVPFKYADGSDLIGLMNQLRTCSCLIFHPGVANKNWNILSRFLEEYSIDGSVSSRQMPSLRYILCIDPLHSLSGVMSFNTLFKLDTTPVNLPEVAEDHIAIIFQTSGSTGLAKCVGHTHASMVAFSNVDIGPELTKDDIFVCTTPFGWIGGFPVKLLRGHTRIAICYEPRYGDDMAEFLVDVIVQERCTVMAACPNTLYEIQQKKDTLKDDWPLKTMITGGQPVKEHFISSLGPMYKCIVYGSTECNIVSFNILSESDHFDNNDCGHVVPGIEVKIVNSDGKTVPSNTIGEIYVKGPNIFRGYYNDTEKSREVFADGDWYKTGDIGRMTEEGSLFVEGRKGNVIISNRRKVLPEIMEQMLSKCPGVEAVVVIPLPDDVIHQVICACVKVVPGDSADENTIRKFCNDVLIDKVFTVQPNCYMFLETFPKTPTGKVSRQALISMATDTLQKRR